jgi:hypothetical protein
VAKEIRHLIVEPVLPTKTGSHNGTFSTEKFWSELDRHKQSLYFIKNIDDQSWMPLAKPLQDKLVLSELAFNCLSQFPSCLLSALHAQHPRCRLGINTFRLYPLGHPHLKEHNPALITSSCLCGLASQRSDFKDAVEGTVMNLASGTAPNLKGVTIFSTVMYAALADYKQNLHGKLRTGRNQCNTQHDGCGKLEIFYHRMTEGEKIPMLLIRVNSSIPPICACTKSCHL